MNRSQIINLKVANFWSFYGEQSIGFTTKNTCRTLTAFYGPNAGGKTNIARALGYLKHFVRNSNAANASDIQATQFALKDISTKQPTAIEVEFTQAKRHFIYGFSATRTAVEHEYLREFASKTKKPLTIFNRRNGKITNKSAVNFGFGKKLFESTRPTTLLITKARENNNSYANILFEWLDNINVLFGRPGETLPYTLNRLQKEPEQQEKVLALIKETDLWIQSFLVEDIPVPAQVLDILPDQLKTGLQNGAGKATTVKTIHSVRDKKQKVIGKTPFDMQHQESLGTVRMFELALPILDTLENGKILYIDEFNSSLHQDLCQFILALFKSNRNKYGAQLIINTHDTSLMGRGLLAREDIIFVEKNYLEETVVAPLADKSVRPNEPFEKRYRQGLYGAKPQVNE